MNNKEIKNLWKLVMLHLIPGAVFAFVYVMMLQQGVLENYPKAIIVGLAGIITIVPIELGILLFIAKKEIGSFNIFKIMGLKGKLSIKELLIYVITLFVLTGLLLGATKGISDFFLNHLFSWIPNEYIYIEDLKGYSKSMILITLLVYFLFFAIIGPIVEELYFRGFLLSRMKWMGKSSVIVNVVLFAIYHFWSPWLILTRIITTLPLYYFVYKKNSLKLGIIVHILCNLVDVVMIMMLLF